MDKTAWGNVKMYAAETPAGETMASILDSIGIIKEESLSISKEDGTKLQLFEEGHILIDELQQEPTLNVACTLIGIPDETAKKFWDTDTEGTGDSEKLVVKSLVSTKKWSMRFAAEKVPGSKTFEAAKCSFSLSPLYSSTEGWTADLQITILKSTITDKLFQFGKVPTV